MTTLRERQRSPAGSTSASFALRDILFTRTDRRGVIEAGNGAFARVSGYGWDEMIGAPHKIVRHPDMPSGVFHVMWERLLDDRPVGAYVVNRAKDGSDYWVFAVVMPIEDGFLSVRIKPSSPLPDQVAEVYARLRTRERDEKLPAAVSAADLIRDLEALGFATYDAFMAQALAAEAAAREKVYGIPADDRIARFGEMMEAVRKVEGETAEMARTFAAIRGVPYNMRILASRLEAAGGPISVISANYGAMSHEIGAWLHRFTTDSSSAFASMQGAIQDGLFLCCAARLQAEAATLFEREPPQDWIDRDRERAILHALVAQSEAAAAEGLQSAAPAAERFTLAVRDMKRLITGLSSTRMMCKIESARLPREGEGLVGVIRQLDVFQTAIEQRLDAIDGLARRVQLNATSLCQRP